MCLSLIQPMMHRLSISLSVARQFFAKIFEKIRAAERIY
jgi:hypothetical protein